MSKFDLTYEAQILVAKLYFGDFKVPELIAWARKAKRLRYKSEELTKLSKATRHTREEVIKIFLDAVQSLDLNVVESGSDIFIFRNIDIAIQFLLGKLTPTKALEKTFHLIQESEDKDIYLDFVQFVNSHSIRYEDDEIKLPHRFLAPKVKKELKQIYLAFAEKHYHLKLRNQLKRRSTKQLVFAKYKNSKVYNKLALIIIDDILRIRKVTKKQIENILADLKGGDWLDQIS